MQVGSDSAVGAGSPIMAEAISRVTACFDPSDEMLKVPQSSVVSS